MELVLRAIQIFMERELAFDRFSELDLERIRDFHHSADTFLRLLEENQTRTISIEEIRDTFPNAKVAREILTKLQQLRYDFGKFQPNERDSDFRWSKLYRDVVLRPRENPELKVPEVKGVKWHKRYKAFKAEVEFNDKMYFLGFYPERYAAARAYDDKLRQLCYDYPEDERYLRKQMNFDEEREKWWFREDNNESKEGPYTWREIEQLAADGVLTPSTFISDAKYSKDWLRLGELQISDQGETLFDEKHLDPVNRTRKWETYREKSKHFKSPKKRSKSRRKRPER